MDGISYYDLRHVTGEVTHIDIDNSVVESPVAPLFSTRQYYGCSTKPVGDPRVDNYMPCSGRKFDELLLQASKLSRIAQENVALGDVPREILRFRRSWKTRVT